MGVAMDQVLLLSLLSMDSYNQRYGFNLNDVNNKNGIGNIRIGADSVAVLGQKSQETGFYAIEYQVDGKSIIAYRGTNPEFSTNTVGQFLASPLVKDIWDGWTLGAGFTAATQGAQAIRFYEAVAQRSVYNPVGNGTQILLTGHSLGGGLAGFVGALSVNRRPIGTPYRRAKGTPVGLRGSVDAGRRFRAAGGVGRA